MSVTLTTIIVRMSSSKKSDNSSSMSMAAPPPPSASTVGFRWLDTLEKDFDKNFVDLDAELRVLSEEYDAYEDVYENGRRMLAGMGSCFIQVGLKFTQR